MSSNNDNNDGDSSSSNSNNNKTPKLTAQEAAIIEMLKQQNLEPTEAGGDAKKKHAFWDTQVSVIFVSRCCICMIYRYTYV